MNKPNTCSINTLHASQQVNRRYRLSLISVSLFLALSACNGQQTEDKTVKSEPVPEQVQKAHQAELESKPVQRFQVTASHEVQAQDDNLMPALRSQHELSEGKSADVYAAGKPVAAQVQKMKALSPTHAMGQMSMPREPHGYEAVARDNFERQVANGIMVAGEIPVSTFSIDTDTGSYSTLRRWINQGRLPQQGTLRVEEMINYFDYQYSVSPINEHAFSLHTELAASPYNADKMLLKIGLKGFELDKSQIGPSNLVFLLDVSGSMASKDKLPLLKTSLKMLSQQLSEQDSISIVVYAGASGVVLDGCKGNDFQRISQALDELKAQGSTNGSAGIKKAYQLAEQHFIEGGVNRVILATDGDFNLGITHHESLISLIEAKRDKGIALTTLGFGQGNYNDHLMEQLADKGNGHYAYIDTLNEARKVLVDELSSTLMTIAKDVKVQVEFNPALVSEYRLIGYENRALNREDFNNDKVDAGEIGAGHTVTALYELSYVDSPNQANDALRYGLDKTTGREKYSREEIAFVKLRYKPLGEEASRLISKPITQKSSVNSFAQASDDYRFSAAVAGLGQLLNHSHYTHDLDYAKVIDIAQSALGPDEFGYRHEFIQLAKTAEMLAKQEQGVSQQGNVRSDKLISPVVEMKVNSFPIHKPSVKPFAQSKAHSQINLESSKPAKYIAPHIKSPQSQLEIDKGVQGVQTFNE
ncbi:VWA domain-containing protein [Shewanella sp. UCD-KL12]|uniref:vWA domain-containing protein n=1 Tax=Shewanella sp. UCD-KL12 TaxID=1917163 RepID=UPI00097084E4|nr:VWA domain-containing protein [Shewanella sp. UCD-KL12]